MPWRIVMIWRNLPAVFLTVFIFLTIFLFQGNTYSDNDDQIDIDLENDPRMVAVNPVTNRAVVTHQHSNEVSIVDLNTQKVLATVGVGKKPKGVAIDKGNNIAIVANQGDDSVSLIDLSTNKVTAKVHVDNSPNNIAVNPLTHIAAVTGKEDHHLYFIDLTTHKVVAKTHIGPDANDIAIDPIRNTAFVINKSDKNVTIIDMSTYKVSDSIHLEKRPQAIDVNPETNTAVVTSYRDHTVTAIDLLTRRNVIIPVDRYPLDVAFSIIDNRAVVLCDRDRKLLLLDIDSHKIIKTFHLHRHPKSVAVNNVINIAVVADDEKDELTLIPLPFSTPAPKITITSPIDNAQLSTSTVNVTGNMENSTSVNVNGTAATISGNTFSATLTLNAGKNTIAATATDKYGRTACHNITVTIVLPLKCKISGTVTNSANGTLVPAAIVSITDATGVTQTIVTIITGTFTAEIAAGAYTVTVIKPWYLPYTFSGTIAAGGTAILNVPLAPSPPAISNVTVTDITGNSAKINWTTDQPTAGIVEYGTTTTYGSSVSDSVQGNTHSITLANLSSAKTYHFRITASANGTSIISNDGTFKTKGQIDITIASPADGASITGNRVIVTGSIANPANVETGVIVNGIAAALINNQFAVSDVPLTAGQNTITVTATDTDGTTATKSITVNVVTAANYIKLSAYPESGTAPMEVTLRINGSFTITNPVITSTGPGAVEQLASTSPDEYKYKISTEGVYYFTAQAIGPDSNTYQDTITITVLSLAQIDTFLRAKWVGLTDALQRGDTASAISFMSPSRRDNYEIVFNLLKDQWPSIIATYSGFTVINIEGSIAKYELSAMKNGKTYVYEIDFVKDSSGLWLIEEF